jgi:hypothetical protein
MDSTTRIKDMPDYRGSTGLLAMDSKLYGTGRVSLEHLKQMMGGGPSGTEYESGTGVTVDNETHTISADLKVVQEKLVEGDGISIVGNRISATGGGGTEYGPGTGIDIDAETHEISIDEDVVATKEDLNTKIDAVDGATSGHVPVFDENGSLTDSGVAATSLVSDGNYVHTDNNYSNDDKSMLAETAEAVQSKQDALEFEYDENDKIVSIDGHAVGGTDITVDTELDPASNNPVANSTLYGVIGNVETLLAAL